MLAFMQHFKHSVVFLADKGAHVAVFVSCVCVGTACV